jgi:hypothetical protein
VAHVKIISETSGGLTLNFTGSPKTSFDCRKSNLGFGVSMELKYAETGILSHEQAWGRIGKAMTPRIEGLRRQLRKRRPVGCMTVAFHRFDNEKRRRPGTALGTRCSRRRTSSSLVRRSTLSLRTVSPKDSSFDRSRLST